MNGLFSLSCLVRLIIIEPMGAEIEALSHAVHALQ